MVSEDAILIDDSDDDEIVVDEAAGGRSDAIVLSDSEEGEEAEEEKDNTESTVEHRNDQDSDHLKQNPFFYIDLTTRNLEEVESTDVRIDDNPQILSMANVRKWKPKSSVQKEVMFNRGSRASKNIDKYLLKEAMRVKAMEQENLDAEVESDDDDGREKVSERLNPENMENWKGFLENRLEREEDGKRPGKRVSKKQLKAKRRKKEQAREEKERNNPPNKESKKQARRRRQKERKLQEEIPTIDLVGYEPTREEILRKKSLEEMKRLEKAEIARITEKRKRDVMQMRMKGMRSKAVAKRLITGHLGVGGKGQSARQRREERYCLELKEDKRRDNRQRKESNLRKLEEEGRAEGLARKLESNNKGFAMLVRMGYSPGDCLGKDQQGRLEPVTIAMRQGRAGLGSKES